MIFSYRVVPAPGDDIVKIIIALAALFAASTSVVTFGGGEAKAQATLPCRAAAERIALAQNGGSYGGPYDSYYERAFSECTNNGDNPFTELPTGNLETLCQRVRCQAAY